MLPGSCFLLKPGLRALTWAPFAGSPPQSPHGTAVHAQATGVRQKSIQAVLHSPDVLLQDSANSSSLPTLSRQVRGLYTAPQDVSETLIKALF